MGDIEIKDNARKTWWLWMEDERKIFLKDLKLNTNYATRNNWSDIPDEIQKAVIEYVKSKNKTK